MQDFAKHRIRSCNLRVYIEVNSELQETASGISILQPGSSVATALSEGESKKKHVVLMEILDTNYRTIKQELTTVRPFIFEQVWAVDVVSHSTIQLIYIKEGRKLKCP